MGEWTMFTIATTVIREVHTSRRAFRSRVMGEITSLGAVGTSSLCKWPTEGDLIRVMLIRTSETPAAAAGGGEPGTLLIGELGTFLSRFE